MTAGGAALVELIINLPQGCSIRPSRCSRVHKLMYFMQEAKEPLRLNFQTHSPGYPMRRTCGMSLNAVEGRYLVAGYADGGDAPGKIPQSSCLGLWMKQPGSWPTMWKRAIASTRSQTSWKASNLRMASNCCRRRTGWRSLPDERGHRHYIAQSVYGFRNDLKRQFTRRRSISLWMLLKKVVDRTAVGECVIDTAGAAGEAIVRARTGSAPWRKRWSASRSSSASAANSSPGSSARASRRS